MARIIIILAVLFLQIFVPVKTFAEVSQSNLSTLTTVQNIPFEMCTKTFSVNNENLFYLTIASINANRFHIKEIQSKTGYILFQAVNKDFLATVTRVNATTSLLKITPANNVYYFQPGIVLNIFKYIELNKAIIPVALN